MAANKATAELASIRARTAGGASPSSIAMPVTLVSTAPAASVNAPVRPAALPARSGRTDIAPGLNPKPGVRVPLAHSMGLNFPTLGVRDLKLIGEPLWFKADGSWAAAEPRIRLDGYDLLAA